MRYILIISLVLLSVISKSQNTIGEYDSLSSIRKTSGYLFLPDSKLSGKNMSYQLGFNRNITLSSDIPYKAKLVLQLNPMISSSPAFRDTSQYVFGLLQPGLFNILPTIYLANSTGKARLFVFGGAGIKIMRKQDTYKENGNRNKGTVLTEQESVFFGGGIKMQFLTASFKYSHFWHDLTQDSKQYYMGLFNESNTHYRALNVNVKGTLVKWRQGDFYIYGDWNSFYLSHGDKGYYSGGLGVNIYCNRRAYLQARIAFKKNVCNSNDVTNLQNKLKKYEEENEASVSKKIESEINKMQVSNATLDELIQKFKLSPEARLLSKSEIEKQILEYQSKKYGSYNPAYGFTGEDTIYGKPVKSQILLKGLAKTVSMDTTINLGYNSLKTSLLNITQSLRMITGNEYIVSNTISLNINQNADAILIFKIKKGDKEVLSVTLNGAVNSEKTFSFEDVVKNIDNSEYTIDFSQVGNSNAKCNISLKEWQSEIK